MMPEPAVEVPVAPPKPKHYRCPNASYTITEAMCQGRQLNKFALCPKCNCRAPLPGSAPSPN
jgi:hypothetical protein